MMRVGFAILALVTTITTMAQNGTVSPYSIFGVGEFRSGTTIDNRAMGGLSMAGDSIHINLQNPAAYGDLKITAYTVGISYRTINFKTNDLSAESVVANLEYLALAFPVSQKMSVGFGLIPYSSVGYNILNETVNQSQDTVSTFYEGSGGLNKVFLGAGIKLSKNFNVGASAHFNFGNLAYDRSQTVQGVQFGTFDNRDSRINGLDVNYSFTYSPEVYIKNDYYRLRAYFGVNSPLSFTSENRQAIGSFFVSNGRDVELVDVDLEQDNLRNTDVNVPTTFKYGLGIGKDYKWFVGAEYHNKDMSAFKNEFLNADNVGYEKASNFIIGGYFIPNYQALSGIYNRMTYRAGFRSSSTGMIVNGETIKESLFSFGIGLPMGGTYNDRFSNLNVGIEIGSKGTVSADLVKENYFGINIGLALNDKWFIKRRID
jgi:hypothetical protein